MKTLDLISRKMRNHVGQKANAVRSVLSNGRPLGRGRQQTGVPQRFFDAVCNHATSNQQQCEHERTHAKNSGGKFLKVFWKIYSGLKDRETFIGRIPA
jgi:hypothetical protein